MRIERATAADVDAMNEISEVAKVAMREAGIDQWQNGYPNREVWQADVDDGFAYVARDEDGAVRGAFAFVGDAAVCDPEPSYGDIDGAWLSDAPRYAAVHRVCVSASAKGRGICGIMLAFAEDKARELGLSSIRIDTHADNAPMQRALSKAGFTRCGTIALADDVEAGSLRIAFEKLV